MATVLGLAALLMVAAGCSTTSAASDRDASTDAPPAFDGGADSGLDAGQGAPPCTQSADCSSGQICCGTDAETDECQAGPCPYLPAVGRSIQLCGSAADCFEAGDTCDGTRLPLKICNAPVVAAGPGDADLDAYDTDAAAPGDATADAADVGAD